MPVVTYLFDPLCGWCYGAADHTLQEASNRRVEQARAAMRRFDITGVPAFLVGTGIACWQIRSAPLFDRAEAYSICAAIRT